MHLSASKSRNGGFGLWCKLKYEERLLVWAKRLLMGKSTGEGKERKAENVSFGGGVAEPPLLAT